jgi:hypothetical protein
MAEGLFGSLCGKQGQKAALIAAASAIAGPEVAMMLVPALGANPTPSQVAAHDAAVQYNVQAEKTNADRQAFIDDYVAKNSGPPSDQEKRVGDGLNAVYAKAKAEMGDSIGGMTLTQFVAAYPNEAAKYFEEFKKIVPEASDLNLNQIMSLIPDSLKNVPLDSMVAGFPKGGNVLTQALTAIKGGSPIAIGALVVALLIIAALAMKKKKPVQVTSHT